MSSDYSVHKRAYYNGYTGNNKHDSGGIGDKTVYDALRKKVPGVIILPADESYETAGRVWNGMIGKYPQVIVKFRGNADVIAAVQIVNECNLPVSVRAADTTSPAVPWPITAGASTSS